MIRAFFFFLLSFQAVAMPEKITVFFLSEQKAQALLDWMDQREKIPMGRKLASFECIPMGEGCFHPQLGYQEEKPGILRKIPSETETETKVKTFNSDDVELVECRKGNHFDIFCGQARKVTHRKSESLEIWFDISASMRKTDYTKDQSRCLRRTFAETLRAQCEKAPPIMGYNTSIKSLSDLSTLCAYQGTNSVDRTVEWIQNSDAKHLVLVTDTEEYTGALRDLLNIENSKVYGMDAKNFTVEDLVKISDSLLPDCKN